MPIPNRVYFMEGYASFLVGDLTNPYHHYREFEEHREWQRGFDHAYFEEVCKSKTKEILNNG